MGQSQSQPVKRYEIRIKVAGTELTEQVMENLIDMVIEEDLAQPSMLVLRFHDPEFTLIDGSTFALGKEIEISAAPSSGAPKKLLTAEVTSLEIEFEQFEKLYVMRAYDKSHRLHRGRKTKSYLKQKDSDIAS